MVVLVVVVLVGAGLSGLGCWDNCCGVVVVVGVGVAVVVAPIDFRCYRFAVSLMFQLLLLVLYILCR